jgi:hypothetical protein
MIPDISLLILFGGMGECSIADSKVLKSPNIIVLGFICVFKSSDVSLM